MTSHLAAAEEAWLLEARGNTVSDFFAEIGVPLSRTTGMEAPIRCFAAPDSHKRDDRTASCSVNLLTGLWFCHACGQRGNAFRAAVLKGYTDAHAVELARRYGLFAELPEDKPKLPNERTLRKWRKALHGSPRLLNRLSETRGWTPAAVVRLGLGWDGERLTIPIRSPKLKLTGLVRYLPGGDPKTLALPGSRRGLFPAPEVIGRQRPVLLVEGEPDAVAVWSAGHRAIAIPGAGSWRSEWRQRLLSRPLIMLADCDRQGRDLAQRVATETGAHVVDLDPSRDDGYDIGDLIREAAHDGGLRQITFLLDKLIKTELGQ